MRSAIDRAAGANGEIHALSNVCRHRMMRLVEGRGNARNSPAPITHGLMIALANWSLLPIWIARIVSIKGYRAAAGAL